ncbi:unnamed protein product [Candidula unifasciata]|uniref:Uncharacterized protein n=1 Tax=Candidula unifasciata TaxID=100452 RepID=A0A8S3ZDT6_9EUPU|nr:unnamed protein product [Candidula unifasciata]
MDDGYGALVQARPLSPGHDIGPDEDRNGVPAQGFMCSGREGEDITGMVMQNGMFIEYLDETSSTLTDITDMPNESLHSVDKALYHEVNRLKTFEGNWSDSYFVQPTELARNGFFCVGLGDKVKCVFCLKTLWNWEPGDSVELEHQKHYPNCPFVQGNCNHLNVPINTFETSLGLHMKTQTQELSPPVNYSERLKSYQNWPKFDVLRPEALAEAGFSYLGEEDQVRCFYCKKVLSNWKLGDDPWCEHARFSPDCLYIQSVKGTEYIDRVCRSQLSPDSSRLVNSMAGEMTNVTENEALIVVSEREDPLEQRSQMAEAVPSGLDLTAQVEYDMKSPAVVAMMTFDISMEKIRERLMQIRLTKGPDCTVTTSDFTDLIT